MDAEEFFSRWSQRNSTRWPAHEEGEKPESSVRQAPPPLPVQVAEDGTGPTLTLEEVKALTKDSDFRPFVARGVDENVRRAAMKKLFSDPHFNVMDGLDVYIDDYSKSVPIPAQVLAMLNHAQALLNPLAVFATATEEKILGEGPPPEQQALNEPNLLPAENPAEIPISTAADNAELPPYRPANDDTI
ncbi:MAG TPA: DUF3306 domain-containing protein [Noviherbaspirillum sp.]|nr:DUF3306 domain-containing protein [Noviherbaspirillum sp.]